MMWKQIAPAFRMTLVFTVMTGLLYPCLVTGLCQWLLREKANGDCVFYESGRGCTVYQARPRQCRTWPFWESNLRTPEDWERTKELCPGSGQGELIPAEEITRRLRVIRL